MQARQRDDRSLGELFSELSQETTTLVREEINLAKAELTEKATEVGKDVGFLAVGGAVLYAGLLAFIAACILALHLIVHLWWLSAAIIAVVVLGIGYALVRRGLDALRQTSLAPTRTIDTLRGDAAMLKEQTR
jgi:cell division protein FtsB